jgi:hypothetical protein
MKGLSGKGDLSGKSAVFSGPLRKNKSISTNKEEKLNVDLISRRIDHLYIGFTPLISKTMHKFTNAIVGFRKLFPTFLFAKRWVHACIFLAIKELDKENYNGFLIEYGAYVEGSDNYENKVYFVGETGLRYTEMNLEEFKRRMIIINEGTNNIPFLKCNVNSINLFQFLIDRIIFGNEFSNNPQKLYDNLMINEDFREKYCKTYCGENYNLITYNCQHFVSKLIEASYATIAPFVGYIKIGNFIYFQKLEINFDELKYHVPPNIVEALKRNEEIIAQRKKEGKSRIVENNISNFFYKNDFFQKCITNKEDS